MANTIMQRIGFLELGVYDPADIEPFDMIDVTRFGIVRNAATVTVPAVLSTGEESTEAGALRRELIVAFHSPTDADSVYGVFEAAIEGDMRKVRFRGALNNDAISADNPIYAGIAIVPQLELGPDVGSLRAQTVTMPIAEWTTPAVTGTFPTP